MSATPIPLPMTPGTLPCDAGASAIGSTGKKVDSELSSSTKPRPRHAPSTLTVAPPPLPRRGERRDVLPPNARRAMMLGIVTLHLVALWGVLQIREVREAVTQAVPMFVDLVAPDAPPRPVDPPPPPVARQPVKSTPPAAVIAAAPSPAPSTFQVPAPTPVAAEPSPPAPVIVAAAPTVVVLAPPPPKVIPTSAIQYLEPIELEYPRLSKRNGETGLVTIRVYIDETGRAKNPTVNRSSGHSRLDEAALAAVQRARFKPYTENGVAVAGWAFIPLEFELEK